MGVMKLYGLWEMPTPTQVRNLAEKWHPLETVGTVLAWRVLESEWVAFGSINSAHWEPMWCPSAVRLENLQTSGIP